MRILRLYFYVLPAANLGYVAFTFFARLTGHSEETLINKRLNPQLDMP